MDTYNKIDPKPLEAFWDKMTAKERGININRKNQNCNRSVFVARTLHKKFSGKYFEVITPEPTGMFPQGTGYYANSEEITLKRRSYVAVMQIEYGLGWCDTIKVMFVSATSSKPFENRKFQYNDLLSLEYNEISAEDFMKVRDLFAVKE